MQKESYNFDTKKKYHQKLEQFIRRFYDTRLRKKKFKQGIRVACFPGHEGLEILNVYDQLGLPRENIVGIERDADIAQKIEDLKLGIKIENKSAADFFEETEQKFDIVNLDYQGHLNDEVIYVLKLLSSRPVFQEKAVLGTNFLGKRETDHGQGYRSLMFNPEFVYRQRRAMEAAARGISDLVDSEIAVLQQKEDSLNSLELKQIRGEAITTAVMYSLLEGKAGLNLLDLERALLNTKTEITFADEIKQFHLLAAQLDDPKKSKREKHELLFNSRTGGSIINRFMAVLIGEIRSLGSTHRVREFLKSPEVIAGYVMLPYVQSYFPAEMERGRYINDHGSPMLFDFMYVKRLDKEFPLQSGKIKIDPEQDQVNLMLSAGGDYTFVDLINSAAKFSQLCRYAKIGYPLPERQFLGSSYQLQAKITGNGFRNKPVDDLTKNNLPMEDLAKEDLIKEDLTKEEALLLLDSGCTPEEITACYSGFSLDDLVHLAELQALIREKIETKEQAYQAIAQLRESDQPVTVELVKMNYEINPSINDQSLKAYIAIDTRRREDHQPRKRSKVDGQMIIDDLAIFPEDLVREKHHLSLGQLRAIKAHQTMGTYEPPLQKIQYVGVTIEGRGDVLGIVQRLEKRYGGLEQIPTDQLNYHKIKLY